MSTWVGEVRIIVSNMSIRYKIAGALVAVLCLAIASLGLVSFRAQRSTLRVETTRRAEVLARQLAAAGKEALLTKDDLGAFSAVKDLQKNPGVAYAFIQDHKGVIFAHSEQKRKGTPWPGQPPEEPQSVEVSVQGSPILESAVPISVKHGDKALRVGTARVGVSLAELASAVRAQKLSFVGITSLYVGLGLLISFTLGRLLTQQIVVLMAGMRVVSEGNLNRLVPVTNGDETGKLAETFNDMILKLREKIHMEKYISTSTLQAIKNLKDDQRITLGGERRHVTVLFSDIRGFTTLSEALPAEDVVHILNVYLNLQAEVIENRGGVVDKFVGDEVMALFTEEDGEYQAALAAREIQNFVKSLNEARAHFGKRIVEVGVGLNCGPVIMGNMGSERRMDYTVIGDAINAAARLCGKAGGGQIVASRTVTDKFGDRVKTRELEPMPLKGKKDPMKVAEILDVPGAARSHMRRKLDTPAECKLSGLPDAHAVTLREISQGGCSFESSFPVAAGARLQLTFPRPGKQGETEMTVQAVVRHVKRAGGGGYLSGVEFHELEVDTRMHVAEWVHHVDIEVQAEKVSPEAEPSVMGENAAPAA
jgi:adenylate cyclase